jgi:hypothetical protein
MCHTVFILKVVFINSSAEWADTLLSTPHCKKSLCYENEHKASDLDGFLA